MYLFNFKHPHPHRQTLDTGHSGASVFCQEQEKAMNLTRGYGLSNSLGCRSTKNKIK